MFDVGFSEILFIVILAIVILGPEGLPKLGSHIGKILRTWQGLKNDFHFRMNEAVHKADKKDAVSVNLIEKALPCSDAAMKGNEQAAAIPAAVSGERA